MKGKVKFFDQIKEFGFIVGEDGKDYFIHKSGLKENTLLEKDDLVSFDIEDGNKGKKATNVERRK